MTAAADPSALDKTLAALDGPPSAMTPSAAHGVIDRWATACRDDGLDAIARRLNVLRTLLSDDRLNGGALASTLGGLAEITREAEGTDTCVRTRLDRAADGLSHT